MKIFGSLGAAIGKRILRSKVKSLNRKRSFVNLSSAKQIGILWDITSPDDLKTINAFIHRLNERPVEVSVLGFFQGKNLPDNLTAIRHLSCVKKEEVSWTGRPMTNEAKEFNNRPFDVLIEIAFKDYLPLRFIAATSLARLKVAPASQSGRDQSHTDMLIEVKTRNNIEEYLEQVIFYLKMINRQEKE
jgi:hypothetical protein